MTESGNGMNRMILILVVLIAFALLAQSKSTVNLAGMDGNQLLLGLTNNSTSNSSLNLSENSSTLNLAGEDGSLLMNDVANASKNLSDWGDKPPEAPLPPNSDPRSRQTYQILKANHGY
jgi:hypothetical protein